MSSDYAVITKYNEEQLGKDTASRKSQVNMYSDFTHFIFEILQNADDYRAKTISFKLLPDRLIIEHNGQPFTTENVKAISYFGKSTSRDDLIKTGHFGLGFKSVFAFTAAPIIHSNDEHFEINGLYRLRGVAPPTDFAPEMTRICLPFNHEREKPDYVENHVSANEAFIRIAKRLKQFDMTTLLFTRSLREIRWQIQGDEEGHYLREDSEILRHDTMVQHRRTTVKDGDTSRAFIVFERQILWRDETYKPVEIAFQLDDEGQIAGIKKPLFVLFPTTVETHMGFLINGPYRTPAHRETVAKDDDFNRFLFEETATLLSHSLPVIREMGLLTINTLETLPIRLDDFPEESMFQPIVEAVRSALLEQPLLPADDGGFVSATNAMLAESTDLRKLLSKQQLQDLFNAQAQLKWLSGDITEKTDIWKYLREKLEVREIRAETLARQITPSFLQKQPDEWMIQFYAFLSGPEFLWRDARWRGDSPGPLRKKEFIRLNNGRHVVPFRDDGSPNAYLPTADNTDFPIIEREIAANEQALAFLRKLGIPEIDVVAEVIEKVLPKYTQDKAPELSNEGHLRDVEKIVRALRMDSQEKRKKLTAKLRETPFIRAVNAAFTSKTFMRPESIYLRSRELEMYFSENEEPRFLDSCYVENALGCFEELGVSANVHVKHRASNGRGHISICDWHGCHKRGLDGFDPDCEIDGLEHALAHPTTEKSCYIWNGLALPNVQHIRGVVESSSRQTFEDSTKETHLSKMGKLLIEKAWLPDRDGEFHKPSELSLEDLPESFRRDERLAKALCTKSNEVAMLAQKVGVEADDIELLKALKGFPEEYQRIKSLITSRNHRPEFPTRISANPDRRQEKMAERLSDAPEKSYERRERSVRTSGNSVDPVTWLRNQYTNNYGHMVCQICEEEMPFKKRDGEYYFEAVEIFSDITIEHAELHLALCPVCAAKYKEFVKSEPGSEMHKVKSAILKEDSLKIPVYLAEREETIRFVETHFCDLKTILHEQTKMPAFPLEDGMEV